MINKTCKRRVGARTHTQHSAQRPQRWPRLPSTLSHQIQIIKLQTIRVGAGRVDGHGDAVDRGGGFLDAVLDDERVAGRWEKGVGAGCEGAEEKKPSSRRKGIGRGAVRSRSRVTARFLFPISSPHYNHSPLAQPAIERGHAHRGSKRTQFARHDTRKKE